MSGVFLITTSRKYFKINKIILDFQIISRDKYLKQFTAFFRKVDLDNNGIINEDEFIKLINYMNCYKNNQRENIKRALQQLDPNNNRTFTYSDLVNFFSKEMIEVTDFSGKTAEINILDKISMD